MPEIKIQHVVSCSSEDKNHPSENLLKQEGTHKWKCSTPGEKSATVVLQFEKASQIHSLDIGNEGSGFIEVLVGRSSAVTDQDYKVLLVASSFMTPTESRNGTNRNSVRMFGAEKLSKITAEEKWDRVKIVCTQPFNKTILYGISFIKFHSPPSEVEKGDGDKGSKKIGAFFIKPDKEDDISTGSAFANRGKLVKAENPPLTGAAAVRAASRLAEESRPSTSPSSSKSVNDKTKEDTNTTSKPSPVSKSNQTSTKRKHDLSDDEDGPSSSHTAITPKPSLQKQSTSLSSTASSIKDDAPPPLKKTKSEPPKESPVKAFGKLMEGVVFVLSGFQNPFRGELRDKAMEMGAKYMTDWKKGCTHLICAFNNTPKYNQVKGKGKIVTKEWITHSYKQKKLLPWKKYRLGDADSPSESSDDEEEYIPKKKPTPARKPSKKDDSDEKPTSKAAVKFTPTKIKPKPDLYGGDTDSGEDTEEEVRRAKEKIVKDSSKPKKKDDDEIYGVSTDEDEPKKKTAHSGTKDDEGSDSGLPDLPDFFADKHFFLYGSFSASERRLLRRYIAAYNGELENYMGTNVNYIITAESWDDNFDEALSENENLVFVKPKWIYACHDRNKLLPYQPFVVVPD